MDPQLRKKTLRMISYGLYILTSRSGDEVAGSTVTWVSQASMTPPYVSIALEKESFSYHVVEESQKFVLHFVGKGQKDIAQKFFKRPLFENGRLNGFETKEGLAGPVLSDLPAYLECQVVEILKKGDHFIILAEVINAQVQHELEPMPLKETGWSYGG